MAAIAMRCLLVLLCGLAIKAQDAEDPAALGIAADAIIITTPPSNAVARVGDDVSFTCLADAGQDGQPALLWEKIIAEGSETISTFFNGNLQVSPKDERMNVSMNGQKLSIRDLSLEDGGGYTCKTLPESQKGIAHLVVIEPPVVNSPLEQQPGESAIYECRVRFAASRPDSLPAEQTPSFSAYLNGNKLHGEEPERTDGVPGQIPYEIRQTFNISVDNDTDVKGNKFQCEVRTEEPYFVVVGNKTTPITVGPHNIRIEPRQSEYKVGDVITCLADGNPTPTFSWTPIRSNGKRGGQGARLEMTSPMVGENVWRCTATNSVGGFPLREEDEIAFALAPSDNVPGDTAKASSGISTTIIIIIVVVVVVVLLVAVIIGVVLYKRKQSQGRQGGYTPGKQTTADTPHPDDQNGAPQSDDSPREDRVRFKDGSVELNEDKPVAAPRGRVDV